jgi:phosphohistidine phosphatase
MSPGARGRLIFAQMATRTLLLLRHTKAVPSDDAEDDFERVLAPRGRRQARVLAGWFRAQAISPDRALSSPAARTRETLDIARSGFAGAPAVEFDRKLYLAPWATILDRIRAVPDESATLLVVGHNPGLHELAVSLAVMAPAKERRALSAKFPTGALARFALTRPWHDFNRASIALVEWLAPADLDPSTTDDD